MTTPKTKYLSYPIKRDVVFVLGAGASHPDGVPLQRHILPMILSSEEINDSEIGRIVVQFIRDNFAYNSEQRIYPLLESVFGFIDYFIQQNESLSSNYTIDKIRLIKEYLIKIIHYIVNLKTHKENSIYKYFWESVQSYNPNVSIITLNYDTLLEQAFDSQFIKFGYLDYCFHLMNYEKRDELKPFNFWINPREPVPTEENETPHSIKILKLHGSLNWKYCNCCNQTLLTPWDREIDLNRGKLTGYTYPDKQKYDYYCPLDNTEFETLIMPPLFAKHLNQPVISQLLSEASREIRSAKKIIFVGYSLSNADVHIHALFKKQLKNNVKIEVINTRNLETLKLKYRSLSADVNFHNFSFEDMVKNKNFMQSLLNE
ncbi:MAG: SIR2 family protein [Bacteroidetes bacterium]|nr:SIR2 family protein [Bacteroidota bacterium]